MLLSTVSNIADIKASQWNALHQLEDSIFTRYEFLYQLENSGSVTAETGWQPAHLLLHQDRQLIAAMPLYIKNHSYGEFVFDWSWANAYRQAGLNYYPKLVSCIPYTPVVGSRLLYLRDFSLNDIACHFYNHIKSVAEQQGYSSWHCLFLDSDLSTGLQQHTDIATRTDIQFHWHNQNAQGHHYASFDDFLACLRSSKRKQIKRERRRVAEQNITVKRYAGNQITPEIWSFFYRCYCDTYIKRSGHKGYLSKSFFDGILATMPDHIMLVCCYQQTDPTADRPLLVASALFFHDEQQLYGRYWGTLKDIDCLHFEACFYQGIEFCIENNLIQFNPGTQGEHKLIRGFEPTVTASCHWIAHPQFRGVVKDFAKRESKHIEQYAENAEYYLPFHRV